MKDLDARLLAAHTAGDAQGLVALYTEAAQASADDNARAFYLTHALVFALETNHPHASPLRSALVAMGRDAEL